VLALQKIFDPASAGSLGGLDGKYWLLVGGTLGVVFVAGSAWAVKALGVLLVSLVVLCGTLVGAVLVDIVVPTGGATVNGYLLVGIAMTFGSVGLAVVRRRRPAP
jgi:transporter family-2 protein